MSRNSAHITKKRQLQATGNYGVDLHRVKTLIGIVVMGFTMLACNNGNNNGNNPGGDTAVTFNSASADGPELETSRVLTLIFSREITGLSADDINLSGVSGISKGTLTNTGAIYTLPISGFTSGGILNIEVSKTGYSISGSPKTVTVYYYGGTPVTFISASADGSDSQTSTELTLVFSQEITGLSAADITLSGMFGVRKGNLSNTGSTYTLPIYFFSSSGTLNIEVTKTGYSIDGSPKTATVYYFDGIPVTFLSAYTNGSNSQASTQLTLVFSQEITGLSAEDITLSGMSGVRKAMSNNTGATYTLLISGFTSSGTLNIAVMKAGYNIIGSPKTATIYYYGDGVYFAVTFSSANANGSVSQTSTELTLAFSQEITELSATDITLSGVSGVSKGALSNTGATYTLPISGFTSGGTLNIAVKKTGYSIIGSPKTATIYYYSPTIPFPIEMIQIQGGTFTMGSPEDEPNRQTDETQHSVTLTGFYMSKYPVTQAQYEAVMGTNPSSFKTHYAPETSTANRPVEAVTWYDAVEFCNKLSTQEGLTPVYTITGRTPATGYPITAATVAADWSKNGYRLPTEAQWEYACRAGTTTAFNTGAVISNNTGWYQDNSNSRTHSVGEKPANAYGLYDMPGNVNEWCWDWYGTYASESQTDPTGAASGDSRVTRGGSWLNFGGGALRSASRSSSNPNNRSYYTGFRLARPAE